MTSLFLFFQSLPWMSILVFEALFILSLIYAIFLQSLYRMHVLGHIKNQISTLQHDIGTIVRLEIQVFELVYCLYLKRFSIMAKIQVKKDFLRSYHNNQKINHVIQKGVEYETEKDQYVFQLEKNVVRRYQRNSLKIHKSSCRKRMSNMSDLVAFVSRHKESTLKVMPLEEVEENRRSVKKKKSKHSKRSKIKTNQIAHAKDH